MKTLRTHISWTFCVAGLLGCALETARAQPYTSQVVAWGYNSSGQTNVPANLTNAIAIAAAPTHCLAIREDGSVLSWGSRTSVPADLTNAIMVAGGLSHSIALRSDGTVAAWGNNSHGQLGVPLNLTNAVSIAAGDNHCLALRADGRVQAWGDYTYGQTTVPSNLTNTVAIAAGANNSKALRADGAIGWGSSPANLTDATSIAVGDKHGLAIRAGGAVVAWGNNYYGQTNVPVGLTNAIAIASGGGNHSLALNTDGHVVAWGDNNSGQTNVPGDLSNAVTIAAGYWHSVALVSSSRAVVKLRSIPATAVVGAMPAGSPVDLLAHLFGAGPFSCHWECNGNSLAGETNATLRFDAVKLSQNGNAYRLIVSNPYGVSTSAPIVLAVQGIVASLNSIPASAMQGPIEAGQKVDLVGSVTGLPPFGYQWECQGIVLADETNATLHFPAVLLSQSGAAYRLRAWNQYDSTTSGPVVLTVQGITATIGASPTSALQGPVQAGAHVDLIGSVTGTAPFGYQWERDGAALTGETNATLRFPAVLLSQSGAAYRLRAWNSYDSTTSAPVSLTVQGISVTVTSSPASALQKPVVAGSHVDLVGSVAGLGPFVYQWESNAVALAGETNSTLHFPSVQLSQSGAAYRLLAANLYDAAATSAPVTLNVQGIVVGVNSNVLASTNFFFDNSAVVGITNRFTNAAVFYTLDGSPPNFTSSRYTVPFTITRSVALRVIAYNSDWTEWDEAGPYYLTLVNYYYTLTTTTAGGGTISRYPSNSTYLNFTNVTLTATPKTGWTFLRWENGASGTNPVISVFMDTNKTVRAVFGTRLSTTVAGNGSVTLNVPEGWYDYGTVARLTGVPGDGSYFGFWGNAASGSANPLLFTVTNPSPVVSCIFGTLAANQTALTVQIAGSGTVSRSPSSNAYSLNQSVTLTATPGTGQKFWGWSGDASGSVSPLTVVMDRSRVITAAFGSTTPPQVSVQPTNLVVTAGQNVEFTAAVTGGVAQGYQWLKDGVPLAGATGAVLSLPTVSFADAGRYAVVVSYAGGSVTSAAAWLVVDGQSYLLLGVYPGLSLHGTLGRTYRIDYTVDVAPPTNWMPLATVTLTNSPWMWFDTTATSASQRFYRAVEE